MEKNRTKELIESLNWRYAVKQFDATKKIPAQSWEILEETLRLTPSSYGLQPWRFLVVQDPSIRKQLRAAAWNQSQVEDCSHYVVFVSKLTVTTKDVDRFISTVSEARGVPPEKLDGYRKMMEGDIISGRRSKMVPEWTARQTYIALGNLMTAAAMLGIDTCPMEGLEPEKFDEILGLKDSGYRTIMACALGYRSEQDPYRLAKKVRYPKNELIEYR